MLKAAKFTFIAAVFMAALAISASAASVGGAMVGGDSVNLRSEPNTSASIITTVAQGSAVAVVELTDDSWYKVNYAGNVGYMCTAYLTYSQTLDADFGTGKVNGTGVRVRSGPDTTYSILASYDTGAMLQVTGVTGVWYKVSVNGSEGYIRSDLIDIVGGASPSSAGSTLGQQIAGYAQNYLGVRYVYGGTSPSGFDCSGFVYYVYRQYGYNLYRVCYDMYYNNGAYVDKSNLAPGDIVFFTSDSSSVGHAGIYIGNGNFVHATSGSRYCVAISSLGESNYMRRYVGAKRIVS